MRVCEALTNVGVCGFNFNLHYELLNTEKCHVDTGWGKIAETVATIESQQ